jgi:5-methylcytosine-specific restriction endonuclease McrA
MRFIDIALPPNLPKKWSKIYVRRTTALGQITSNIQRTTYFTKNASWGLLKSWLSNLSHKKCWYCEANSRRSPFDVDHFRPKLGVTVDSQPLMDGFGYYWLAYEWWNFRLSCQRCNRPEKIDQTTRRGKWNEFPIESEHTRCAPISITVDQEAPRFLVT